MSRLPLDLATKTEDIVSCSGGIGRISMRDLLTGCGMTRGRDWLIYMTECDET